MLLRLSVSRSAECWSGILPSEDVEAVAHRNSVAEVNLPQPQGKSSAMAELGQEYSVTP